MNLLRLQEYIPVQYLDCAMTMAILIWQVYDMQFELNEIEARREQYPSTISFINLLNALIAQETDVSDRGRRYGSLVCYCFFVNWIFL